MNSLGLALCCRYSNPPNSLALCGPPDKNIDLSWYTQTGYVDLGTAGILEQFHTLYNYLQLISYENGIKDPFDPRVVEAYWLGNSLLSKVYAKPFARHLTETLDLKRKIKKEAVNILMDKIDKGALPHHAFHVMNVYRRTGHLDIEHTLSTMDACIINWGKVEKILPGKLIVKTQGLTEKEGRISLDRNILRTISTQGEKDIRRKDLNERDFISYHWGRFCQKLSQRQLKNLSSYTLQAIKYANS